MNRMSIKYKIMLVLLLAITLSSGVQFGIENLIIMPSFATLQNNEALEDIDRCIRALKSQVGPLSTMAKDWSAWDDTYAFVVDHNAAYLESTLCPEAFVSGNINLLHAYGIIRDMKGEPALLVEAQARKTIIAKGRAAILFASWSILFVTVITLIVTYFTLDKTVLSRILRISTKMDDIAQFEDLTVQADVSSSDELGRLEIHLNKMLGHLANTRQKIIRAKQEWESTFDAVPDLIAILDNHHRIKRVNKSMARRLGTAPEALVGKLCYECVHGTDRPPASCPHAKYLAEGGEHTVEIYSESLGGHFCVSVSPLLDPNGDYFGVVHVARDINESKQTQDEILAAKERAEFLAQEAQTAARAKGRFLANMSHEIRTPMNAIIGFSGFLADENLTLEQRDHVNTIRDNSKHLLNLIDDILDFSRIEAGKPDIEIADCSLKHVLAQIESMMRYTALKKGLTFAIQEHGVLPATIRTDADRLQQCFGHLVSNAIKFTEQGHVFVNVSLEDKKDRSLIRFDVKDTGIGIPAGKQQEIFESFTQADSSTTRQYGGTGLGLAITRQLAGLLGGELMLTSEQGHGSIFSLVMPTNVDITQQCLLNENTC